MPPADDLTMLVGIMNKLNLQNRLMIAFIGGLIILAAISAVVGNQVSQKLSTPQLIERAYDKGRISEEERLLYLAYAIFEYESLPKRFRSNVGWRGTATVAELYQAANSPAVLCSMSPRVRSEFQRILKPKITCD
jgi:hypothetical protein